jgi:hypothetical protein
LTLYYTILKSLTFPQAETFMQQGFQGILLACTRKSMWIAGNFCGNDVETAEILLLFHRCSG